MVEVGQKAPLFTLPDQNGEMVSLESYRGQKVVLYFYPRDNTPGCTRQAQAFAAENEALSQKGAVVLGISKDSVSSHQKFAAKYELPFRILSDPDHQVLEAYGVWQEKKLYGKVSMGTVRTTFLIDEEGVVQSVMKKVKPDTQRLPGADAFVGIKGGYRGACLYVCKTGHLCPFGQTEAGPFAPAGCDCAGDFVQYLHQRPAH